MVVRPHSIHVVLVPPSPSLSCSTSFFPGKLSPPFFVVNPIWSVGNPRFFFSNSSVFPDQVLLLFPLWRDYVPLAVTPWVPRLTFLPMSFCYVDFFLPFYSEYAPLSLRRCSPPNRWSMPLTMSFPFCECQAQWMCSPDPAPHRCSPLILPVRSLVVRKCSPAAVPC